MSDQKLRNSLAFDVACISPLVVWWAAAIPGFFSPDSLDVLNQVTSGDWTSVHTLLFTAWVYTTSFGGEIASTITLAQALLLGGALIAVLRQIFPAGVRDVTRRMTLFFMSINPSLGGFSVMAWKDVPYAAGVLICGAVLMSVIRRPASAGQLVGVTLGGVAVAGFRWNGPITVTLFLVVLVVFLRPNHRSVFMALMAALLVGVATLIIPERLNVVDGPSWVQLNSRRLHDIAVGISDGSFIPTEAQIVTLTAVMPLDNWVRSGNDCTTHDEMMFSEFSQLSNEQRNNLRLVEPLWHDLLRQAPQTILRSRGCKLLPTIAPVALGANRPLALWSRPNNLMELSQPKYLGGVSELVTHIADSSNTNVWIHWLFFRPPVWLLFNLLLLIPLRRFGIGKAHLLPIALAIAVQTSAGLVAVAQDFRYTAAALLLLQANVVRLISDGFVRSDKSVRDVALATEAT